MPPPRRRRSSRAAFEPTPPASSGASTAILEAEADADSSAPRTPTPLPRRTSSQAFRKLAQSWWSERANRWTVLFFLALMAIGCFYVVVGPGRFPIWIDELHTLERARQAQWGIVEEAEKLHTAYFVVIGWFLSLFGESVWSLRCYNLLTYALSIPVMGALAWLVGGRRAAIAAAALTAFNPRLMHHAGEARYYTPLFLYTAIALLLLLASRRRHGWWALPVMGLVAYLVYETHPASAPYLGLLLLGAFVFALLDALRTWQEVKTGELTTQWQKTRFGLSAGAVGLCALAGLAALPTIKQEFWTARFQPILSGEATRAPNLIPGEAWTIVWKLEHIAGYHPTAGKLVAALFFATLIAGMLVLAFQRRYHIAVAIPLSIVIALAIPFFIPSTIMYAPKYSISILPGILFLQAVAFASLWGAVRQRRGQRTGRIVFAAALGFWMLILFPSYRYVHRVDRSATAQTLDQIASLEKAGGERPLVLATSIQKAMLTRYLSNDFTDLEYNTIDSVAYGPPMFFHALATGRPLLWAASERNEKGLALVKRLEPFLKKAGYHRNIFWPEWSIQYWRPGGDLVAIPGRSTELTREQLKAAQSEQGLSAMFLGRGKWQARISTENAEEVVSLDGTTSIPMTLRLPEAEGASSVRIESAWNDGRIRIPGGLAHDSQLLAGETTPKPGLMKPVLRNGRLAMAFHENTWASYLVSVPEEPCHLEFRLSTELPHKAFLEVMLNGQVYAIIATDANTPDFPKPVLTIPEDLRGTELSVRVQLLSSTYKEGDRTAFIDSVDLVQGHLPLEESINLLFAMPLVEPHPDYLRDGFPPPEGSTLWDLIHLSQEEDIELTVEEEPEGRVLRLGINDETPTTQVFFPGFPVGDSRFLYVSFEGREVGPVRHSAGLFFLVMNERKERELLYVTTNYPLGGDSGEEFQRVSVLLPLPPNADMVIPYWQVYQHPEKRLERTSGAAHFELRKFEIYGVEQITQALMDLAALPPALDQ